MKKDIIIAFSFYGIGGAQTRAFTIANKLVSEGYNVSVIAVFGRDGTIQENENYYKIDSRINFVVLPEYYADIKNSDISIQNERFIKNKISLLKKQQQLCNMLKLKNEQVNYKIKSYRQCKTLRRFFLEHDHSLILSFGFAIYDIVYFAAKGLEMKIIYAETNSSNKYINDRFCANTKNSIKKADSWIFQTKEQAKEHGLLNNMNSFVVRNPIKQNLPERYTGERKKIIVNFCRLARQKNLILLIEAFNIVKDKLPDYILEIYADTSNAANQDYKEEILECIHNNGLSERVFLLAPRSDIHEKILTYSLFVSSSDYEGISNSMIEAMAIGLPCVCTDCDGGSTREIISDCNNGLLVPKGNKDALAEAIFRILSDRNLFERCSENATKIKEALDVNIILSEWISIIKNILGECI